MAKTFFDAVMSCRARGGMPTIPGNRSDPRPFAKGDSNWAWFARARICPRRRASRVTRSCPLFAALFDPGLVGDALALAIAEFPEKRLSKSALARVSLMRAGAAASATGVMARLPNGETRKLEPGPSSVILKAAIEEFAVRFLQDPAVLWLSESGRKVVARDDDIAASIGLKIEPEKELPDLILADLGPADPLIVFVEAVATDGPISPRRQKAFREIADAAGFSRSQVAFVTAFLDRDAPGFRKTVSGLAWGSFAWFASEPKNIVHLRDGSIGSHYLIDLL